MKKMKKLFIVFVAVIFTLSTNVYASNYVKFVYPKKNKLVYIGNKYTVRVDFDCDYIDDAFINITCKNKNGKVIFYKKYYELGRYKNIKFTTTTKNLAAGKYYLSEAMSNVYNSSINSKAATNIVVKRLPRVSNLKLKLANGGIRVSYKKVKPAKKYEIYRSVNNKDHFKKIKTTTKTVYQDKNVRAGKVYYYKVRAVRNSARGKFSKIKKIKR